MGIVNFFQEDVSFVLPNPIKTRRWIRNVIKSEGFDLKQVNYIFCSDDYLLDLNNTYLGHDYYTDILTFDNSENDREIEGDIFISLDRVFENAGTQSVTETAELRRVLVHGILHLCGLEDESDAAQAHMREKENYYLSFI